MRISCNGCRVLRKGCSDDCTIRPCLEWIKSPESQANATVFLAKFYGRAGLVNLINAAPDHLRPGVFTSLLYEACGRIVNPIYGSTGLLSSGNWQLCQGAVEAVLKGSPITPMATDAAEVRKGPPMKAYDIRHVYKEDDLSGSQRARKRCRPRRSKRSQVWVGSGEDSGREEANGSLISHESSLSHQSSVGMDGERRDQRSEPAWDAAGEGEPPADVDLDLTLGLKPNLCPGMGMRERLESVKQSSD